MAAQPLMLFSLEKNKPGHTLVVVTTENLCASADINVALPSIIIDYPLRFDYRYIVDESIPHDVR